MPEEKPESPQETPETTPAETSASGESMRTRFESLITDPYAVLGLLVYVLVIGGLLHAMADAFTWGDDVEDFFDGFLNDIWVASGAVGLTLGMIAIVHGIRTRKGGNEPKAPSTMSSGLLDPVRLFTFAPWVFASLGIIKVLYDLATFNNGQFEGIMSWVLHLLFYISAGFFFMIALKSISDWLHSDPNSKPATAAANTQNVGTGSDSDGSEPNDASGPSTSTSSFSDSLSGLTADTNKTLMFGIYLTAYLGALALVFNMWWWWDDDPDEIWQVFFHDIALVGGTVAFLMIARPLVNWIIGNEVTGGEIQQAEGESRSAWLQRVTGNPMHIINIGTAVALLAGGPFFLVELWSSRNWNVDNFWSQLLENMLLSIVAIGTLLVLRSAAMIVLSGSSTSMGQKLKQAAGGPLLNDPGQLLRILVYLIAFVGLANVCLTVWTQQGDEVWEVWYYFLNSFGVMLLPLAMALGGKAMYAEISD